MPLCAVLCCGAGEPNTKDSLLIAGDKLPHYLAGAYTLGDALADLCEVPGCKAQLMYASNAVQRRRQLQQQQQQRALLSPFAQANASAAAAAAAAASRQPNILQVYDAIGHDTAAAASEDEDEEDQAAAAALAAGIRVPRGFAIGSFSSKGFGAGSDFGSNPSLLQLLERERTQQQQQREQQSAQGADSSSAGASTAAAAAAVENGDDLQAGFADEYLDPPMPTADQLSLFTEVQRFVGRRRLRPVLHSTLHRMVFAMPFDNRIRITLDTDVRTTALVSISSRSLSQTAPHCVSCLFPQADCATLCPSPLSPKQTAPHSVPRLFPPSRLRHTVSLASFPQADCATLCPSPLSPKQTAPHCVPSLFPPSRLRHTVSLASFPQADCATLCRLPFPPKQASNSHHTDILLLLQFTKWSGVHRRNLYKGRAVIWSAAGGQVLTYML
jgi:hypothetical protein